MVYKYFPWFFLERFYLTMFTIDLKEVVQFPGTTIEYLHFTGILFSSEVKRLYYKTTKAPESGSFRVLLLHIPSFYQRKNYTFCVERFTSNIGIFLGMFSP